MLTMPAPSKNVCVINVWLLVRVFKMDYIYGGFKVDVNFFLGGRLLLQKVPKICPKLQRPCCPIFHSGRGGSTGLRAEPCYIHVSVLAECRRLLARVLEPQPSRRLTLRHVAVHPWLTHKGLSPIAGYQHPRVGSRQHTAVSI